MTAGPATSIEKSAYLQVAGLVLAAGESSRMGRDKALLLYKGRTFLEVIMGTIRAAGVDHIAVVLGHHAEEIRRTVELGSAKVVINSAYPLGQTSSLQAGLEALERDGAQTILLCLVDHPAFSTQTVRELIAARERSGARVVVPTFRGKRGHPVLIGRALLEELKTLEPEEGANSVIRRHRNFTAFVEVPDSGILLDVDDSQAYHSLE